MKRVFLAAAALFIILCMTSCGGGSSGNAAPAFVTQILSDPAFDGTITLDPLASSFTITQGMTPDVQSVFAGIDPATGAESRAFLDFPLTGAGGVPGDAVIVSAILDIVITSIVVDPTSATIPVRIDLVSFQPPTLLETDFSRTLQPALVTATISPPLSQADFGAHVSLDVTSLMVEAQRLGLPDFQVRILEDIGATVPGLVEINDTTGAFRGDLAPLLQVTYF
jgi:hypothetical protein